MNGDPGINPIYTYKGPFQKYDVNRRWDGYELYFWKDQGGQWFGAFHEDDGELDQTIGPCISRSDAFDALFVRNPEAFRECIEKGQVCIDGGGA